MGTGGVSGSAACRRVGRTCSFAKQDGELVLFLRCEVRELPDMQGFDAGDGVLGEEATTLGEVQVIGAPVDAAFDQALPFEFGELVSDVAFGNEQSFSELLLGEAGIGVDVGEKVEFHDGQVMLVKGGFDLLEGVMVGARHKRPEDQGTPLDTQILGDELLLSHSLNLNKRFRGNCDGGTRLRT